MYDYRNRLTEVETGGTIIATYTYNALNQRIGIQEGGSQIWTVYNGKSANALPYADFNASGTLLTRYVSGPGMVNGAVTPVLLARTSSGGATAWYLTDKLDSVRDIVSSSGSLLDHIVYDSFGNILTETVASNGDRFKFAGMQFDSDANEYFDHARWYAASDGTFTSMDPLGFGAADTNLHRYSNNAPTLENDPSGEIVPILVLGGIGAIAAGGSYLAGHLGDPSFSVGDLVVVSLFGFAIGATIGSFAIVLGGMGIGVATAETTSVLGEMLMTGTGIAGLTNTASVIFAAGSGARFQCDDNCR